MTPRATVLPTQGVIREAFSLTQGMVDLDFDLDEIIGAILSACHCQINIPHSVEVVFNMFITDQYCFGDQQIFYDMIKLMYDRISRALIETKQYDDYGVLTTPFFIQYGDDILVSNVPIDTLGVNQR